MWRVTHPRLRRYGVAVISTGMALQLTLLLKPLIAPTILPLFYAAVTVSAWYGGMKPGLLATILSTLVINYFFVAPVYSLAIASLNDILRLGVFVLVTLLISTLNSELCTAKQRLETSMLKLQASEEQYRRIVDTAYEGIWTTNAEFKTEYVNQRMAHLLGYSVEEMLGHSIFDFMDDEAQIEAQARIKRRKQPNKDQFDFRYRRKDGSTLWTIVSTSQILDERGQFMGAIAMITDITLRKQAEEERIQLLNKEQAAKEQITNTLESISDAFVALDSEWRYTYVNTHAEHFFQKPREELIGKIVWEVFPPLPNSQFYIHAHHALSEQVTVEYEEFNQRFQKWILARIYPSKYGLAVYFRDITLRKQTQQSLQDSEEQISLIIDSVPIYISYVDSEQRYRFNNRAYEEWFGYSRTQITGKHLKEVMGESIYQSVEKFIEAVLSGQKVSYESAFTRSNGEQRYVQGTYVPHFGEGGEVKGFFVLVNDITERKQAEEALRQSEERYRAFVEQSSEGIWRFELEQPIYIESPEDEQIEQLYQYGYLGECNNVMAQMYGYDSAEEIVGARLGNFLVREDINNIEYLQAFIRSGYRLHQAESYEIDKQGNFKYFVNNLVGIVENGLLVRAWGTQNDITLDKQAEATLIESEKRFKIAAQCATDVIYEWDIKSDRMEWFGKIDEHLGYEPGEFPRTLQAWENMLHPDDRDRVIAAVDQHLQTGEPFFQEYRVQRKDGTYLYWTDSATAIKNENGKPIKWIGVNTNITERKRAEKQILRYANRLQVLAEASRTFAEAILDYQTALDTICQRTVELVGDTCTIRLVSDDGQWLNTVAVYHPNPEAIAFVRELSAAAPQRIDEGLTARVFETGESLLIPVVSQEQLRASIKAEYLPCLERFSVYSLLVAPLRVRGRIIGTIALSRDKSDNSYTINDQVFLQDLADRAALAIDNARLYNESVQANRMKDEFLATLSHELRTPLNAMLGWTQLLRNRQFDPTTTAKALETIDRNTRSLSQLIEDVLDVSRIITGKLRLNVYPVELLPVIEAAIDIVLPAANAKEIYIESILDRSVVSVLGDSTRLQQIVWNLLSNAVKFTPSKGRVTIKLSVVREQLSSRQIETLSTDNYAQIQISDTGAGISPDFLPYVFERFRQADGTTTRSHGGLGLGLAIVRHLVELQGGTVHAESLGEGQGATFTVRLPLIDKGQATRDKGLGTQKDSHPTPIPDPQSPIPLNGLRVLIVDDEADARDLLSTMLAEYGAEVTAVPSVSVALETLQRLKPDVLVSDIGMPEENGYSLIRKIRALDTASKNIPAVALTAYARAEDRTQALLSGFQLHVPKPVDPAELAAVIANLAGRTGQV
ncbi:MULTISPECIES: hybrid sensor histidine kinase/response regulator [Cyanophyceae]|uniref:hybrid sensor histidine kinase/response regulator n=1 Tax=Cyanophyceae TaxID=3028117 RepID=UPI00168791DF|nr:PAS domain S-box protein [Trichocoleus sp. FACHB-69]MBD1933362.1 PAS domain S-box protein [Trichocoleus sp. FACHB-69]